MNQVIETASLYEKTLAMNQALVIGSLHQHELVEVANASILAREQAEEALRQANEVLEARVAERTRELTAANLKLQAEAEERELVEETLRQAQKMEAVGQLTGGIAHDFNNLLHSVMGNLELVRIRVGQGRTAELGRYIQMALGSAERAAALTQRLLAFSRRQTLDPKSTDVNRLINGMMELLGSTLPASVQITTKLKHELWLTLCDPNQLENALLNMVINARDALPDGGRLVIETVNIAIPETPEPPRDPLCRNVPSGEYVTLSVMDTGIGMPPDVANRAFDPFFTTKPLGQGTGLGLSMIYGFVQQSGGHVRLRSQDGRGTTVKIYLPRYFEESDPQVLADVSDDLPMATAGVVVLVVEDELAVRLIVVEVLSDLGYTMIEAVDGPSSLPILESGTRIDLLITDIGLPGGMSGQQLAAAAREQHPGLKVLFITGHAESVAVDNDQTKPGIQVLTKPFMANALANKVHQMVTLPDGLMLE